MYKVLYLKFEARQELLEKTQDLTLIENSPFDKFWGCGKKKNGLNVTGKLLMLVRDHLLNKTEIDFMNYQPEI